jgi:hypothetical protein
VCSQPHAFLPTSFIGDSSFHPRRDQRGCSATRKRNFRFSIEGTFEDEYVARQAVQDAVWEAEKEKVAKKAARHQARVPRVNFEAMGSMEYSTLR